MDKAIAVVVLIVVIAVLLCGELYFRLEKSRSILSVMMGRMRGGLSEWTDIAKTLFYQCGGSYPAQCREMDAALDRIPDKQLYRHTEIYNQIHTLVKQALSENLENTAAIATGHELSDKAQHLVFPFDDFNTEAAKLNKRLDGPLSSLVGRLFKIEKVTPLDDFSVL